MTPGGFRTDHLGMFDAWRATVESIRTPPEVIDSRILHSAELAFRIQAFSRMPEGPENALALLSMAEAFQELRGDNITDEERKQVDHAFKLAEIATERARKGASDGPA